MKQGAKIEPDKIHVLNIRTIKGNINAPENVTDKEVEGHKFGFDLQQALMHEENVVGLKMEIDIQAVGPNDKELPITGAYTHEMVFEVENMDDFLEEAEGQMFLHPLLGSTLASIMYSTIRGIIFGRTQGTSLGVVVLPVVNPMRLLGYDPEQTGIHSITEAASKKGITDEQVIKQEEEPKKKKRNN